jgi:peroxiredoxin
MCVLQFWQELCSNTSQAMLSSRFLRVSTCRGHLYQFRGIKSGEMTPTAIVDIVEPADGDFTVVNGKDFGALLRSHKKAVVFALPGAFTPICSEKHLPGFIEKASQLRAKGVEAVYCLSWNDSYVMKAWARSTKGLVDSGIKLVADGNGDYTRAVGMEIDLSTGRLGKRCARFAALVEGGVYKFVEMDAKGLERTSADSILAQL